MGTRSVVRLSLMCMLLWLGEGTLLGVAAYGAAASQEATRAVLQAELLEYMSLQKRLVATGAVSLVYGRTRVFADRVEVNTETGVGVASGRVRLLTPDDDIQAARLEFELSSTRGLLYNASGVIAQDYRVTARRIERLRPQAFAVYDGRLTTCVDAPPDWEFRTQEAQVGLGAYVRLKHPSFWVKGIPVFYIPYLILPLQDERTTGFLPPRFGASRRDGAVVGTEFFWALTDWMDATLGLEYLSNKGWRPEGELRYAVDPLSDGQVRGSFIHEQDTGEALWKVFVQQRQEFGWGIRGLSQLDLRSERDLDRQFARDIALESMVQTDSFVALSKRFSDGVLSATGAMHEAIRDSGSDEVFRRLPGLHFQQFPTSLLGLAFFAVEASYARLSDTEIANEAPVQRLDVFPTLTVPVTFPPWMHLSVTGGFRQTFYDRQATGTADTSRHLPDLQAHLQGPRFWRRYGQATTGGTVIHLVEPSIAYRYVPSVDQSDILAFETLDERRHFLDPFETHLLVDRISAVNYVKVSVRHRLFVQNGAPTGVRETREVARFSVSQGLDLRQSAARGGQRVGPLDLELDVRLWQFGWVLSTVRLAPDTGTLQESNWRVQVALRPGWVVYVANQYRRDPDIFYVSGGAHVSLSEKLQVGYGWRYDGELERFREHQATLSYLAQCWRLDMRFRWRDSGDTEVSIRLNLWSF